MNTDLELEPEQPEEVTAALRRLLASAGEEPSPWWRAGLDEALET